MQAEEERSDSLLDFENLRRLLIQPHRVQYNESDMDFAIQNRVKDHESSVPPFAREDFTVESNTGGGAIMASLYLPSEFKSQRRLATEEEVTKIDLGGMPCIIYLHSQGGSRLEGSFLAQRCLSSGVTLCVFDFLGCGQSEGKYVSLGLFESLQVKLVIDHLESEFKIGAVCLWGRSMGAVTALYYASSNQYRVAGMVLDSPFSCLKTMIQDVAYHHYRLPSFLASLCMTLVSSSLNDKLGVDLFEVLIPVDAIEYTPVPVTFLAGSEDDLVLPKRVHKLYSKYGHKHSEAVRKHFFECKGGHNDVRAVEIVNSCFSFLMNEFQIHKKAVERLDRRVFNMSRYQRLKPRKLIPSVNNPLEIPRAWQKSKNTDKHYYSGPRGPLSCSFSFKQKLETNTLLHVKKPNKLNSRTTMLRSCTQTDMALNKENIGPDNRKHKFVQSQNFQSLNNQKPQGASSRIHKLLEKIYVPEASKLAGLTQTSKMQNQPKHNRTRSLNDIGDQFSATLDGIRKKEPLLKKSDQTRSYSRILDNPCFTILGSTTKNDRAFTSVDSRKNKTILGNLNLNISKNQRDSIQYTASYDSRADYSTEGRNHCSNQNNTALRNTLVNIANDSSYRDPDKENQYTLKPSHRESSLLNPLQEYRLSSVNYNSRSSQSFMHND